MRVGARPIASARPAGTARRHAGLHARMLLALSSAAGLRDALYAPRRRARPECRRSHARFEEPTAAERGDGCASARRRTSTRTASRPCRFARTAPGCRPRPPRREAGRSGRRDRPRLRRMLLRLRLDVRVHGVPVPAGRRLPVPPRQRGPSCRSASCAARWPSTASRPSATSRSSCPERSAAGVPPEGVPEGVPTLVRP